MGEERIDGPWIDVEINIPNDSLLKEINLFNLSFGYRMYILVANNKTIEKSCIYKQKISSLVIYLLQNTWFSMIFTNIKNKAILW